MITFKTNDIKTSVAGAVVRNIKRPGRGEMTRHKIEIPGRAGSWDFGGGVEKDYLIEVEISLVAASASALWTKFDTLVTFLSGKGELVFADATSKKHMAQVYNAIEMQRVTAKAGTVKAVFECEGGYVPEPEEEE